MRTPRRAALGFALSLGAAVSAQPVADGPPPGAGRLVPVTTPLKLAGPVQPAKTGAAVYLVKLKEPGAASYRSASILAAPAGERAPEPTRQAAAVQAYARRLELEHDSLLGDVGAASAKLYSYRYALNGFAAKLTPAQAAALARRPEVERVWPDSDQYLATNNSAAFLGLESKPGGLRAELGLTGENVVVGVIDSGIAPNHPSLRDTIELVPRTCRSQWSKTSWLGLFLCGALRRNPPTQRVYDPPIRFRGACEAGEAFAPSDCNNKVVGARFYLEGFLSRHELDEHEFRSPRDADGHGTHVATTIAGNSTDAILFGTRVATVAGIAPRARIAVYKACWVEPGAERATCATSDLARAVDDAVADGVDIINYSLGSLETELDAPDDLALLNAFDAGVLTVVAAGNDGPGLDTIGSPSSDPWVLTVGASTQSGTVFDDAIAVTAPSDLAGSIVMREASFTPPLSESTAVEAQLLSADDGIGPLGADKSPRRDACEPLTNAAQLRGRIALIERGTCEFQVKVQRAQDAGAVGVVVYNNDSSFPIVMNGDPGVATIPAVMITEEDGLALLDALAAGDAVRVKLARGIFVSVQSEGNFMADFSSRGPSLSDANFLKPDATAPGVDILAGTTPTPANGVQGERFEYFSGTSQSAPEAAGVAALLKEAHPDWSPAALKSALMTSAHQRVQNADGSASTPLDRGAGHIDPNRATDPGLVYENDYRDHAAYLCGLLKPPFPADECAALAAAGYSTVGTDVNMPSISVAELVTGDAIKRRVKNIGPPATYRAELTAPPDIDVVVEPSTLVLGTGETAEYSVRFTVNDAPFDLWDFGELRWTDGTHTVTSPIAEQPVALRVAREMRLAGASGSEALPIAFGYDGPYTARAHGLRAPFTDPATGAVPSGFVDDDPTNHFSFPLGTGVALQGIDVPPGQLYLRVALFDEFTDGADDLDLYLFYCPNGTTDNCEQVGQSGGFTSDERIDVTMPEPGLYVAAVHGFETDQVSGGPGAHFSIFAWSFGVNDDVGNLEVTAPTDVAEGDRPDLTVSWSGLAPATRYLGAISHDTPYGVYELTIVDVASP